MVSPALRHFALNWLWFDLREVPSIGTLFVFITACAQSRDEHWTGLGLDWIRTMRNFVDSVSDSECELLYKFWVRSGFGLSNSKRLE